MGLIVVNKDALAAERHAVARARLLPSTSALPEQNRGTADRFIDKIRKFIPPEITLAWAMLKNIVETDNQRNNVVAGFWVFFVIYTPVHVMCTLSRETNARAKRLGIDRVQTWPTFVAQAAASTVSFILFSMTLGAPFTGPGSWGLPKYLADTMPLLFLLVVGLFDPGAAVERLGVLATKTSDKPVMTATNPLSRPPSQAFSGRGYPAYDVPATVQEEAIPIMHGSGPVHSPPQTLQGAGSPPAA